MSRERNHPAMTHSGPPAIADHQVGGYRAFAPPDDLAFAVEAAWTHYAATDDVRHRVVPDPAISLCYMGAGEQRLSLIGPVAHARIFEPGAGHRMAAVRLKLEHCRALLGVDPHEHEDATDAYAEVLQRVAGPLEDRLHRSRTSAEALGILIDFVRARVAASSSARASWVVRTGMEMLRAQPTEIRVAAMSARLGVSDRHLRRTIAAETGISPRRFARVQRFHALLREVDATPHPAWAMLAAGHGYADQSHLIHEVQELAGVSPARLLEERRAEPRAPIAEATG
ncbi:MAG: helix-turn-helix domain-containing protein [Gemmatimonadaceae bacterium]